MAGENTHLVQPQIRSPRSAAIAGIVFSVLMIIAMLLVRNMIPDVPADISRAQILKFNTIVH